MCVCAWYKMAGTPSEFPPGVLEQAIDYVAGEVSKDVQMRRLVSKYHASINVEFSDYAAATKSLMQDGALTNLFRAAVQKRAWFLKKQLQASNIESSQEEATSEQTSTVRSQNTATIYFLPTRPILRRLSTIWKRLTTKTIGPIARSVLEIVVGVEKLVLMIALQSK